jgi:hypothetical protein
VALTFRFNANDIKYLDPCIPRRSDATVERALIPGAFERHSQMTMKERQARCARLTLALATEQLLAETHTANAVVIMRSLAAENGVRVPAAEELEGS